MRSYYVILALFSALVLWNAPAAQRKPRGAAERLAQPAQVVDPNSINQPNQPELHPGDRGGSVVRAQILLGRAHFSCGQVDGEFGSNLQKAVAAYQQFHNLAAGGIVDAATWAALNADKAPLLTEYTITADDEKGPFVQVPKDMMEEAKLDYLGYASPLDEFAERFHSSTRLLQALNPGADFTKPGQQLTVPNVMTMPPGQAATVIVSKSESSVRAYDAGGNLLAFYVATIGSTHDPLPIGTWKIAAIQPNPWFHYNPALFWDAKPGDSKAAIHPGPRNPVGLVWMDLSKEHYGIHGTPDPDKIGHTYSHGCIRLTNWDAIELASMVQPGTPAILKE